MPNTLELEEKDLKMIGPVIILHGLLLMLPEFVFQTIMFVKRRRQQRVVLRR